MATQVSELEQFVLTDVRLTRHEIGKGAYGSVVEVIVSGHTCAAKTIHEEFFKVGSREDVKHMSSAFVRECKLASVLNHPNIVKFLGVCYLNVSKVPSLVMERLETSLHDCLESPLHKNNISLRTKVSILFDVSRGLTYLHGQKSPVIHRDLTARNVLLTSERVAKIADLGVARMVNLKPGQLEATMTRGPGNIIYMPPEAMGYHSRYNASLDVFSFGNLALFTLTQVFPNLKAATYTDPDSGSITGLSEIERREESFSILHRYFLENDILSSLTHDCLQNLPTRRPTASQIVKMLQSYMDKHGISPILKYSEQSATLNLSWREMKPAPAKMDRPCDAIVNDTTVYFRAGGTSDMYSYNCSSEVWSLLPTPPTKSCALAVINNLVTTIGGYPYTNKLFSLTGKGNDQKWTEKFPPMPTKRRWTIALCSGSNLIVAGGDGGRILRTVEVMHTKTLTWFMAAELPEALYVASATVIGDRLYILGGVYGVWNATTAVYMCSVSALLQSSSSSENIWNRIADLPVTWSTCVSLQNQVLAIGGRQTDGSFTTAIHMYDEDRDSWEEISHMSTPRRQCFAVVLPNHMLMVVGGWSSKSRIDSVELANVV